MCTCALNRMTGQNTVEITLKYGGCRIDESKAGRKNYECGRQRTIRVDAKNTSLQEFCQRIAEFCPWVRGQIMKLSYTIPNTNPRQFADTRNNVDYTKVIAENTSKKKVKIFLTTEETVAYTPRSYQLNIWRRIHSQKMPRGVSDKAKHVECIGVMS